MEGGELEDSARGEQPVQRAWEGAAAARPLPQGSGLRERGRKHQVRGKGCRVGISYCRRQLVSESPSSWMFLFLPLRHQ